MNAKMTRRLALGAGASVLGAGAMLPARAQTATRLKIQTAVPSGARLSSPRTTSRRAITLAS